MQHSAALVWIPITSVLIACGAGDVTDQDASTVLGWQRVADLPEPTTNNAVAAIEQSSGCALVSALGIDASRVAAGIHTHSWISTGDAWESLPDLAGPGRIAASAVGLRGRIYVLGGYSVTGDGDETSHASVEILDPSSRTWSAGPPLPVPIDDAVAVAWRDRWIVVVSGWSNTAPVSAVQIFDADSGDWTMATAFPGTAVFGHAGAIAGDDLVIVDGVAAGISGFAMKDQAWHARLDPQTPTSIAWTELAAHPGPPRYRAAAGNYGGLVTIHGGTAEPYNFEGLTYETGTPATPLADAIAFDPLSSTWVEQVPPKMVATMDHRGLVGCGDQLYTIGGMEAGPTVTRAVWQLASQ